MLDENRLRNTIRAAFNEAEEKNDAGAAMDRIAEKLAKAIVAEVRQLKITYTAGLNSTSGGPVSGIFNYTIQ
ncbi:hypothetical protein [Chitinophaga solisilvae]|uniref:hypothetical protein n=1 Tax=Chitinophaga solisilvae TaxID=1233460 RepID=UPI00136F7736|nr:hypothetical protein [Chitinophaga solisilvae]